MAMEFWGVEVKAGEPLKVEAEEGILVHLSQASLGEVKKDKNESVLVSVNIDGKKIILGTLSSDKCPQITYDLVFEKEFELSHNWKNGSVYFCGYKAEMPDESEGSEMFDSESEEEDEPIVASENGKAEAKPKALVEKAKADKPAAKKVNAAKPVSKDSDDSDEDDSDDSEDDSDDDMEMAPGLNDDDSSEEDGDSSDEEEDTPKNAKQNKKRPAESGTKTPVPEKKTKLVTPQKSGGDGKKGGNAHTATPHPSKQAGKAKADKSKSPKSAGQIACKSCSKTFNSDGALQSHNKAKHSEAK